MGITTWIIIIFILAFLGFNVFAYLAEGTQEVTNIFSPLVLRKPIISLFSLTPNK
jgi:hypothetical protein